MSTQIDQSSLLKKIAKERLKPYGILQKGQSRTFLYDKGWFTIIIEFQPSSFSKGTYLNIGVDLNVYPRDNFAFGYGYRETGFDDFKDEDQFIIMINNLCDLTIIRVKELDQKFVDFQTALKTLNKEKSVDTWRTYEVAILNALTSNFNKATIQLKKISIEKCEYDWEFKRKKIVDELIQLSNNDSMFLDKIKNLIYETRQLKKLPEMKLESLTERKTASKSSFNKKVELWFK